MRLTVGILGFLVVWGSAPAMAQRRVQYDTISMSTPAAVSCGFCANEKFGLVFRPLDGGRGLRPTDFPLMLQSIEVAVARAVVTGDFLTGYTCQGSSEGGTVSMMVEAYAGVTPPTGSIQSNPASGPWSGETMVFGQSADLQVSVETTPGSRMYNVMFNTLAIDGGIRIDPPNTYVRVVVTIPSGGTSASCTDLGLSPPAAVGLRDDDGRIASNVDFIYSAGGIGDGWFWNEDPSIMDPATFTSGINGDWGIRVNVTPLGGGTDAGMPMPDAGMPMPDAGTTSMMDSGTAPPDAGSTSPMCSADADCAGGERCVDGMCRRVSCTAASDCAGGMTCVDGMCRNLCSSNAECNGGEVCDDSAGYCVPVAMDGGCGCRAAAGSRGAPLAIMLAGILGLALRRRRQLARSV